MFTTCSKLGCNELVEQPNKYCDKHKHIEAEQKKQRNRWYDKNRRDDKATAFYKSKEWRALRKVVLIRDNHLCQECLKENRITVATLVHHKVELKDDWSLRNRVSNLESVCDRCHNKIHKRVI